MLAGKVASSIEIAGNATSRGCRHAELGLGHWLEDQAEAEVDTAL